MCVCVRACVLVCVCVCVCSAPLARGGVVPAVRADRGRAAGEKLSESKYEKLSEMS